MRERKSIATHVAVRVRLLARRARRSKARKLKEVPGRLKRWWSIYSLRLSWGLFFLKCGSIILVLGMGALSYLFFSHLIFQTVEVSGSSMFPTLINTDLYWCNKFAYELHNPRRGDVVAIKDPSGDGFDVKRIIATPSESIYISHGKVYVDGKLLREPYLPQRMLTFAYEKSEDEFFCLAPGQYFVMGDNRGDSCDSRTFGPIERDAILGKVIH